MHDITFRCIDGNLIYTNDFIPDIIEKIFSQENNEYKINATTYLVKNMIYMFKFNKVYDRDFVEYSQLFDIIIYNNKEVEYIFNHIYSMHKPYKIMISKIDDHTMKTDNKLITFNLGINSEDKGNYYTIYDDKEAIKSYIRTHVFPPYKRKWYFEFEWDDDLIYLWR